MNEIQLVILFRGWDQLHFVREGPTPQGAFQVAYTLDAQENIVREWFLYHDWCDGVELMPHDSPMVRADSLALNKTTTAFDPRLAIWCPRKPVRLLERWSEYHKANPRIINSDSLWERFKTWLS